MFKKGNLGIIRKGDFLDSKYRENYFQLGLNIAYYRKQRGLSQMQLSELIGVSRTHMSRIETADCAVSLDVVFRICETLDTPPNKMCEFR